ncbi:2Fe-2S iron-sulfur cluster-binding protein [Saccharopolyspora sp. MS10]|uniref:2Fe-2S iron-sulfur cluster-binding protein n=1 Tax=Saccharopolyspora sp. MS10 TaxID=3385973 RepID=UPI0039A265CC
MEITWTVDGESRALGVDPRVTVLDGLREQLGVTSVKKGCDHGQCGACTALVDGRRVLTCLALAVAADGAEITTAAGLGAPEPGSDQSWAVVPGGSAAGPRDELHPVARAFLEHDGFQCGFCTPGQVCSAVGMLDEAARGMPSHATEDVAADFRGLDDAEIRERMSGNLCRCGAYVNILAAIRDVAAEEGAR